MQYNNFNYPNQQFYQPQQQMMYSTNQYPQYSQVQPQPIQQPSVLVGRIVNDVNDIRPNETPTTGQPAVFPKADGSMIYLTCMDQTGRIVTKEFVPNETKPEPQQVQMDINSLQEQLKRIEKMLTDLTA